MNVTPPADFQLEKHVFYWISQALAARNRRLATELRDQGVRTSEWRVLGALYARQHLSMGELSEQVSIDRTTLSRTVDRMEQAGWMARISDASDMRVTRLRLTDAGREMFHRVWPIIERVNASAARTLPEAAVGMVSWVLGEMKRNLDNDAATRADDDGLDQPDDQPTARRN